MSITVKRQVVKDFNGNTSEPGAGQSASGWRPPPTQPRTKNVRIYHELPPLKGYSNVLIAGPSGSGKTTVVMNIVQQNRAKWDRVYLICASSSSDTDYDWIPKKRKFRWSASVIQSILNMQKKRRKQAEKACKEQGVSPKRANYPGVLLICDDIIGEIPHNDKILNYLASTCRHYRVSLIISVQRTTAVSPTIRINCNVVLGTRMGDSELDVVTRLADCFGSGYHRYAAIDEIKLVAKNYTFLYWARDTSDDEPQYRYVKLPLIEEP